MPASSCSSSLGSSSGQSLARIAAQAGWSAAVTSRTIILDGEALAAAAGALGVGVGEDEPRGEIVLDPVHGRANEVEQRSAVDVESAARSLDLLVERIRFGH